MRVANFFKYSAGKSVAKMWKVFTYNLLDRYPTQILVIVIILGVCFGRLLRRVVICVRRLRRKR